MTDPDTATFHRSGRSPEWNPQRAGRLMELLREAGYEDAYCEFHDAEDGVQFLLSYPVPSRVELPDALVTLWVPDGEFVIEDGGDTIGPVARTSDGRVVQRMIERIESQRDLLWL